MSSSLMPYCGLTQREGESTKGVEIVDNPVDNPEEVSVVRGGHEVECYS